MPPAGTGIKQRLQARLQAPEPSPLFSNLASSYARGHGSAASVVDTARAAFRSCASVPDDVASLSRIANRPGKARSKNVSRRLRTVLRNNCGNGQLRTYPVKLPMWCPKTRGQASKTVNMLLIHEILHAVIPEGDEAAWASFDEESTQSFQHDLAQWCERLGYSPTVPVVSTALWGDSAPLQRRASLYLLTLKLLSGKCKRRFWLLAMTKRYLCKCKASRKTGDCGGKCTFDKAWAVVAWSLECLLTGFWPKKDHLGKRWKFNSWRAKQGGKAFRVSAALLRKCAD